MMSSQQANSRHDLSSNDVSFFLCIFRGAPHRPCLCLREDTYLKTWSHLAATWVNHENFDGWWTAVNVSLQPFKFHRLGELKWPCLHKSIKRRNIKLKFVLFWQNVWKCIVVPPTFCHFHENQLKFCFFFFTFGFPNIKKKFAMFCIDF